MDDVYETECWGQRYAVRADWTQASDQVFTLSCDGEFVPTQYQVANFQHRPEVALRSHIEEGCDEGITDEMVAEIDAAMDDARYYIEDE